MWMHVVGLLPVKQAASWPDSRAELLLNRIEGLQSHNPEPRILPSSGIDGAPEP